MLGKATAVSPHTRVRRTADTMPSPRNVDSWVEQVEHGSMPTALSAFLGFFHGPTKQDRENLGVRGASASGMTKKEM